MESPGQTNRGNHYGTTRISGPHWRRMLRKGLLAIDNNAGERELKLVAIGRKKWLFSGNDAVAENHTRLWTLIASYERHQVDPQRYLTSLLAKIGTTPDDKLKRYLPDTWKSEDITLLDAKMATSKS